MSEMQLIEEQHIYEVIRSGITKGGSSFEMARHVLDALSDDGYIITRPSPIIPEDAFTARYIEGCGAPPTAQDDVVVEPVKCPDPENCKANGNCTSSEPVTDDDLHEAILDAQNFIDDKYEGSITRSTVQTLITHAINAEYHSKLLACYGGTEKCGEALAKERYDAYTQGFNDAIKGQSK